MKKNRPFQFNFDFKKITLLRFYLCLHFFSLQFTYVYSKQIGLLDFITKFIAIYFQFFCIFRKLPAFNFSTFSRGYFFDTGVGKAPKQSQQSSQPFLSSDIAFVLTRYKIFMGLQIMGFIPLRQIHRKLHGSLWECLLIPMYLLRFVMFQFRAVKEHL